MALIVPQNEKPHFCRIFFENEVVREDIGLGLPESAGNEMKSPGIFNHSSDHSLDLREETIS